MTEKKSNTGYILLVSVIIMSAVLLLLAQSLSSSSYFQRRGTFDFSQKESSYYTALSCIDRVIYNLSYNLDYIGNETLTIGSNTCTISPLTYVSPGGMAPATYVQFTATATVNSHKTTLFMLLDSYGAIAQFKEL